MHKIKLAFLLLGTIFCSACVSQQNKTENTIITDLKTLTPECRKVYLVGSGMTKALENMMSNNYILGTQLLCMSYRYYEMDQTEINLLSEISDDYFRKTSRNIADSCLDVIEKEGDNSVVFFARKAEDVLQSYVSQNVSKCKLNHKSLSQN